MSQKLENFLQLESSEESVSEAKEFNIELANGTSTVLVQNEIESTTTSTTIKKFSDLIDPTSFIREGEIMVDKTAKLYQNCIDRFAEFLDVRIEALDINHFTDIQLASFFRAKGIEQKWSKSMRKIMLAAVNLYMKLGLPPKSKIYKFPQDWPHVHHVLMVFIHNFNKIVFKLIY
jgi:hypothetical protein